MITRFWREKVPAVPMGLTRTDYDLSLSMASGAVALKPSGGKEMEKV
jgi:hypothetical protein